MLHNGKEIGSGEGKAIISKFGEANLAMVSIIVSLGIVDKYNASIAH